MRFFQEYCFDCGNKKIIHLESWIDGFLSMLPPIKLPKWFNIFLDNFLEKFFVFLKILKYEKIENVNKLNIALKLKLFILKLQEKGAEVLIGKSVFGYSNYFKIKINNKVVYFYGLPVAGSLNYKINLIDNKDYVKQILIKNKFPVPKGKSFWFWQKEKALKYAKNIGFPLVVKPENGSVARHVTINILDDLSLKKAISKSLEYAPKFLIEEFINPAFVYRATVIDFENIFCVKQIPANIVGDGKSTILELINKKNNNPLRGKTHDQNFILHKILINETTYKLLLKKNYDLNSIPLKGEIVYLQNDPFLRWGGDLEDVSFQIHPDNKQLFLDVAKLFNIRVVGIDFMIEKIEESWKKQKCGILELNTCPSIEMHALNFTKSDILEVMFNFFKKYYL